MDDLLLKNYELLSHIKNEYDKLANENESLKLQLNQNINTITPNNIQPNTKKEENEIIKDLIDKYPTLKDFQTKFTRLFIHKKYQDEILNIITNEDDKTMYKYYYGLVRKRKDNKKKMKQKGKF
jgi:hypothetical protein